MSLVRVVGVLVLAIVAGCATPKVDPAKTTVVLLPDEDGNVGAVLVSNVAGTQRVDEAYSATVVQGGRVSAVDRVGERRVGEDYAALLDAQPPKPKSFMLHFLVNRTVLTEESKAQLPAVMDAIRERKPTEITIFGHADSTGTDEYNLKLSGDRARAIAALLKKQDPSLDRIDIQWFGSKAPLVPDARSEVRNRRAEIQIL